MLLNVNNIPVLNPDIVTGVALMTLFLSAGLRLGFVTMLISHVLFCIPYVILAVLPKLRQLNKHTAEAAMDLGATPSYALRKVILPEIKPGIVSGALMAFTMSIDDFVISFFTTGNEVSNLSILIYSMAKRGVKPTINALSTLMFVTVVILLLIINKKVKKERSYCYEKDPGICLCSGGIAYHGVYHVRLRQQSCSQCFQLGRIHG